MSNNEGHQEIYTDAQHEKEVTRVEIQAKRWFIAWLVTFAVLMTSLIGTNLAWVIYENSFQDVMITQNADTWDGGSNYLNGTGEFSYGARTPDDQNPGKEGVE